MKNALKPFVPRPLWRFAKSMSRGSAILAADYSEQICADYNVGFGAIAYSDDLIIWCPDNAVANAIFRMHFFEKNHRAEIRNFLHLSAGCINFIDVGASGGIFSAVFARSRAKYNIVSIEPDKPSVTILGQTRDRNHVDGNSWSIESALLSDNEQVVEYESSGYGGEIAHPTNRQRYASRLNRTKYTVNSLMTETLPSIVNRLDFKPDLLKIDIESYEHEVICSSKSLLRQFLPRLALELHIEQLRNRGLDPIRIVATLNELGYRTFPGRAPIDAVVQGAKHKNVLHMTLAI